MAIEKVIQTGIPSWQIHFLLNLIGFLLIVAGIISVLFLRGRKKWFYTAHKYSMTIGVILVAIGVLWTGLNVTFLHAYIGLIVILGLVFALIGGWLHYFWRPQDKKMREQRKKMRKGHIVMGYIFALGALIALFNILNFL